MLNTNKMFFTVEELYEILPIGKNAVYKLVKEEGFPKLKVGKKIIIPVKGFMQWVEHKSSINNYI
ncbi:helix-turn-helix domain-containing protein [Paenibacillus sp. LS1]|uniref:helix-turn-helix domain-containing protein n=1 Tax=Paenibacillus sp. LS1 TaxID=2992120 RepID=UPI00222ED25F|nr:helix-turn-helix domain-containing protein [Paenibacillus sp. LS1]MCW3795399.1 helix-turn-helix domain-containing protein [Paenibacillus sp. LS1]